MPEQPALKWDLPDPFIHATAVADKDIDSFGHANNVVYLRWLTECAWAHSAAVGLTEARCLTLRRGMAVRTVKLEILHAAMPGDRVWVGNWLTAATRLRATRTYQIINPDTATTLLRGAVDFVCINLDTGAPARMPAEFVAGYSVAPTRAITNAS